MKLKLFTLLITLSLAFAGWSQPRVLFSYNYFLAPGEGPYVEFYLNVDGSSVEHVKMADSLYHAKLEVTYIIKKGEKIKDYRKFEILGPGQLSDTLRQDFVDLKRFSLKKGEYTAEIMIKDLNSTAPPATGNEKLLVEFDKQTVGLSDIIWYRTIEPTSDTGIFVRNGYDVTPWIPDVFPKMIDHIYYYAEMYNANAAVGNKGKYVIKYYVKNLNADSVIASLSFMKVYEAGPVQPLMGKIDLSGLPMGDYLFGMEVYDSKQHVITDNSVYFYRISDIPPIMREIRRISPQGDSLTIVINSITSRDTIQDYIKSIRPVANISEQKFIDNFWRTGKTETLKKFFINFWLDRNQLMPLKAWNDYREKLALVNKEFSTPNRKGYETDRGIIYLKYGAPNQIVKRENEPSSYPYIIWQYYQHPKQSNAKYVFYNPDLVTNDYILLYSNVRGEMNNNYKWQYILQMRDTPYGSIDKTGEGDDQWGGRVNDYYENPR